jgi:lipopolysaccharide export system permease protein
VIVALFAGVLAHLLVPASLARLTERGDDLAENVVARLFVEGQFLHPSAGVVFYIARITPEGELDDVFLSDARNPVRRVTYTADTGLLVRTGEGPRLIMLDGMMQSIENATGRLSVTRYDQLTLDMSTIAATPGRSRREIDEIPTWDLFAASPDLLEAAGASRGEALYEAHGRVTHMALAVTAPLLGVATLLLGGFSRFGIWRRVVGAVALLVALQSLALSTASLPIADPGLWPLYYLPTLVGLAVVAGLLHLSANPGLFRPRRRRSAA